MYHKSFRLVYNKKEDKLILQTQSHTAFSTKMNTYYQANMPFLNRIPKAIILGLQTRSAKMFPRP